MKLAAFTGKTNAVGNENGPRVKSTEAIVSSTQGNGAFERQWLRVSVVGCSPTGRTNRSN